MLQAECDPFELMLSRYSVPSNLLSLVYVPMLGRLSNAVAVPVELDCLLSKKTVPVLFVPPNGLGYPILIFNHR